jgi:hypothetical protein
MPMTCALRASVLVIVLAVGATAPSWWRYASPRVYKTASSPDGSWSVTVFRQREHAFPLKEGVEVTVVVTDSSGRILLRKVIDSRDVWEDVDLRYRDVICKNDEILVGPDWWDGKQSTYYRITKRDTQ